MADNLNLQNSSQCAGRHTVIFEKALTLSPKDDKTNIYLKFNVPENIWALVIDYSYAPKILENKEKALEIITKKLQQYGAGGNAEDYLPIKNLITLSFDKNGQYIGAAHRQPERQKIEISESFATPGIVKCAVENAAWQIALNVHCCMEKVNVKIKVEGVCAK
ncbi:MAG: hypothetical protein LUH82_02580 [Clostridiales bacterium]|nr:hypothetical protein [Clostridiales bacterium]